MTEKQKTKYRNHRVVSSALRGHLGHLLPSSAEASLTSIYEPDSQTTAQGVKWVRAQTLVPEWLGLNLAPTDRLRDPEQVT